MKKIVKKLSLLLVVVLIFTTLITPAASVDAVVYPSIKMEAKSQNGTYDYASTNTLYFKVDHTFEREKYIVEFYTSAMEKKAEATGELNTVFKPNTNHYTNLKITFNPEKLNMTHGMYVVKCYMQYYSGGNWYQVPYENTYSIYVQKNELRLNGDQYYYYKNDVFSPTNELVKYNSAWHYVENGIWASTFTGLVKCNNKWFFIENGIWNSKTTTLYKLNGKWFFIQDGKWIVQKTLVKYQGKYFYVVGGKWDSTTKGLIKYNGKYFLIKSGKWANTTTTLTKKDGKLWYVKNGKWSKSTAIVKYNGKKYYAKNGYAQTKVSGRVKIGSKYYTVKKGIIK